MHPSVKGSPDFPPPQRFLPGVIRPINIVYSTPLSPLFLHRTRRPLLLPQAVSACVSGVAVVVAARRAAFFLGVLLVSKGPPRALERREEEEVSSALIVDYAAQHIRGRYVAGVLVGRGSALP